MSVFLLTFALLLLIVLGMSLGVLLAGKRITGSCGGLNALSGSDQCQICRQSIDPDMPLRQKFQCPRRQRKADEVTLRRVESAQESAGAEQAPARPVRPMLE